MKPFLLTLITWIAVILGAVGLGVLAWGLWRVLVAARTRSWPTVPGTIVSSRVTQRAAPVVEQPDAPGRPRRPMPDTLYKAEVIYRYGVEGRTYEAANVTLENLETSAEGYARGIVERYRQGAPVTVSYDPARPERAVLEPGAHSTSWLLPAIGLVFLIVAAGLGLFVRFWYLRK